MNGAVILRYGAAIAITGTALGVLAPLDSDDRFWPVWRYLFWMTACTAGWLQAMLIARGVRSLADPARVPGWALFLISALILTLPVTFEVRWLWTSLTLDTRPAGPFWGSFLNTLVLNLCFTLVQFTLVERWPLGLVVPDTAAPVPAAPLAAPTDAPAPEQQSLPQVHMLRRRPEGMDGPILALSAEDHYLRVHGPDRSDLVLYRLGDAIEDLAGAQGWRTHRSWWVARNAVAQSDLTGRDGELVLTNGTRVPVSRSRIAAMRAALE